MNDRAAWLEERRRGMGGTDAAGALGVSKWKTELSIYLDKRDETPPVEKNEAMHWGIVLQNVVRDEYKRRTGAAIYNTPLMWSKRFPWMLANTDGRRQDDRRIVEIKTARSGDDWGPEGSAEVPVDYLCQVTHYMIVAEVEVADIAVLIAGADFRIYTVPLDRELADMIIEAERVLWDRIQRGDPPAPRTAADIAALYRIAKNEPIEASEPILRAWHALLDARQAVKSAETVVERLEGELKQYMGACDTLTRDGMTLATWKQRKASERLDTKRLKAEAPEVYQRFAVTGEPTRTFLLKEVKQ